MASPRSNTINFSDLRDNALAVVKARGEWRLVRSGPWLLIFHDEKSKFTITYRTPIQKLPEDRPSKLERTLTVLENSIAMPYGIDVWLKRKRLNLEWSEDGHFNVIGYLPGPWEVELKKLLQDSLVQQTILTPEGDSANEDIQPELI